MPDETTAGPGAADEAGSAGGGESGGSASSDKGGAATDWKAKYEELERTHQRVTGKAGSTQSTLQTELATEKQARAAAEAEKAAAQRELRETKVLEEVLAKAPEKTRAAIRLAARGLIPGVEEPDPQKAAAAVLQQIEAAAPELLKPSVATVPHVQGGQARAGLAFTKNGERLF